MKAVWVEPSIDLTRLDGSEEDKIRAMMTQSTQDYDPSKYANSEAKFVLDFLLYGILNVLIYLYVHAPVKFSSYKSILFLY